MSNLTPTQTSDPPPDLADRDAWDALKAWMSQDAEGRKVLERLKSNPREAASALDAWLQARATHAPPTVANYVSGGNVDRLINVAQAAQVVVQLPPERVLTAAERQDRRSRSRMLERVRRTWITGYLEDSLHGAALQALGMKERPDAVPDRWGMVVQQPDRPPQALPFNTSIEQVFNDLDGELLVLGDPGSGKTIMLLELTRSLLERAQRDETLPMPIVFALAPWAAKRQSLSDWLVDELNQRYDVPRQIGRAWVADDRILPLLDGLDEVATEHRAACVEAINAYRESRAKGLPGLLVTSRVTDYDALTTQLRLRGAVFLQRLQREQIEAYLASAGAQLVGLRAALQEDATLRDMAASPLLLSTMTLAYRAVPAEALRTSGTFEERRTQLFAVYVEEMFKRRGGAKRYSPEQSLRWLGWLARALTSQNQTTLYLERVQPEWLTTSGLRRWYTVIDRLGSGVLVGLVGALMFGLVYGPVAGLEGVLAVGLVGALFGGPNQQLGHRWPAPTMFRRAIVGWLVVGLVLGLIVGLVYGYWVSPQYGLREGISAALVSGVAGGLAATLTAGPAMGARQIEVVETIGWSTRRAVSSALSWSVIGLVFGLVFGLQYGLAGILAGGLVFGLVFGIISGLTGGQVEARATPNQGIRRSWRSAILGGLVGGLLYGLVFGLISALRGGQLGGVLTGLTFAFTVGLAFGGYACLSHCALRFVLWRADALPLRTVTFLEHATERIFLRKVGGGYIFVHRLLQEYFASLEPGQRAVHERGGRGKTSCSD